MSGTGNWLAKLQRPIRLVLMSAPSIYIAVAGLAFFLLPVTSRGSFADQPAAASAGQPVEFAIAGIIDLDDDGMSDLATLRSLITDHNGRVAAICTRDGTVRGKVTQSASYLVVGAPPEFGSKARLAFVEFVSKAKAAGSEVISLSHVKSARPGAFASKPAPSVFKFYTAPTGNSEP